MYALRFTYILVALWHILPYQLCAQSTDVTSMLDGSVMQDLINCNDGSIAVYESNDERIAELMNALQGLICLEESNAETESDCLSQNSGNAIYDSGSLTFFLENTMDNQGFSAIIQELKIFDADSLQLRHMAFIHFPENEESMEIRSYINPQAPDNEVLLWKTDLFSSQYFTKSRTSAHSCFDVSVITGLGFPAIQIKGEWADDMVVRLFTYSGKEVWQNFLPRMGNTLSVALPRLESGLYILLVSNSGQQKSLKLFIAP